MRRYVTRDNLHAITCVWRFGQVLNRFKGQIFLKFISAQKNLIIASEANFWALTSYDEPRKSAEVYNIGNPIPSRENSTKLSNVINDLLTQK
jgi:hypothetical protein